MVLDLSVKQENATADMKVAKIWRTPLKEMNTPSYVGLKQQFIFNAAFSKFLNAFS